MNYINGLTRLAVDHPVAAATVIGSGCLVAAPMMVAAPLLGIAGFSSQGIAAGSIAAGWQAGIGNVIASSAFATAQSAAIGGYGTAMVVSIAQGAGAAAAAGGAAYGLLRRAIG